MALVRLQDPLNPDCPVIKAYLSLIIDGNPLVSIFFVIVFCISNLSFSLVIIYMFLKVLFSV